jgi:hypothetical protein
MRDTVMRRRQPWAGPVLGTKHDQRDEFEGFVEKQLRNLQLMLKCSACSKAAEVTLSSKARVPDLKRSPAYEARFRRAPDG